MSLQQITPAPASAPTGPRDQFGRVIDYLRISLTDHCNLRCVYCMPENGLKFLPPAELLTAGEIASVVRVAVEAGFRKFRLTGGEPTLRADLLDIVRQIAAVPGVGDLAMTTNGILLPTLARPLRQAGLRRVNIHVDSLDPERLGRIMRWGRLDDIWRGIKAAEVAGFTPLKLNAVVTRGYNDDDVAALAGLTIARDWHFRFIELMPFGTGEVAQVARENFISNEEVRARIEAAHGPLTELPAADASDESRNFRLAGARGVVGFISPVSAPYCGSCNRMRLTAEGKLHLCLLNDDEMDIKRQLRQNGPDAVRDILLKAVHQKPVGHRLRDGVSTTDRRMFQIGG
jgi:cyclic pyranopterin phosphate synthase